MATNARQTHDLTTHTAIRIFRFVAARLSPLLVAPSGLARRCNRTHADRGILEGEIVKAVILIAFALMSGGTNAQMMVEAVMRGQALTTTKQGDVSACGIRIVGIPGPIKGTPQRMFDTSLNITKQAVGIAKMIASVGPAGSTYQEMRPTRIFGVWFKTKGLGAVAPLKGLTPGETPHSNLFLTDWQGSAETIGAMAGGDQTQIAVSWQKGIETIYYGKVELDDAERQLVIDCFDQLK